MLHKLSVLLAVVLVVAMVATPTTAIPYTFTADGGAAGVWNNSQNWSPNTGTPGANDTATIPNGKTCTVDTTEAAQVVTVQSGGTLIIDGDTLTVGATLGSGTSFDIQSGGTLNILSSGVVDVTEDTEFDGTTDIDSGGDLFVDEFYVGNDVTLDGDLEVGGSIWLTADVEFSGSGTLDANGAEVKGSTYDLTIGNGVTANAFGKTSIDAFINHGTINVTGFTELLGNEVYGSGLWNITGTLKSDEADQPVWLTPGDPGTFKIDGVSAKWIFGGDCDDFQDELIFIRGTFTFREDREDFEFRNCGHFEFGGHASDDMVIEIEDTHSFEVGGTCSTP